MIQLTVAQSAEDLVRNDLDVAYAVAQPPRCTRAMRNGFSEVLRSCAMDQASRAWERGRAERGNQLVSVASR